MLTTHLAGNYASDLYEHIKRWERYVPTAYYDSMKDPSQVTIGVGFNIEGNPQALNEVLRAFGFSLNPASDPSLSAEGRIAEQTYINLIKSTITLTYGGADLPTRNALLQAELDKIMLLRASDERLPLLIRHHSSFEFKTEAESKTVFNALLPSYEEKVDLWLKRNGLDVKQKSLLDRISNSP